MLNYAEQIKPSVIPCEMKSDDVLVPRLSIQMAADILRSAGWSGVAGALLDYIPKKG